MRMAAPLKSGALIGVKCASSSARAVARKKVFPKAGIPVAFLIKPLHKGFEDQNHIILI